MSTAIAPQAPIANWQQVRDEWVAEVERMADDIERWAKENDWDTKRETKENVEYEIGGYEVPMVRIHTMQGRAYIDPTGRFVGGATGRMEIVATPSFFQVVLCKIDGEWRFLSEDTMEDLNQSWSREGFTRIITDLLKRR
ncbi:MAG TPA: hypothetical protein VFE47_23235 [Tepidisphaeraceae bacterium]|jgi:hypothetical protein|nr:hypothetical protein [Tepidisphaeraceae bacterium]